MTETFTGPVTHVETDIPVGHALRVSIGGVGLDVRLDGPALAVTFDGDRVHGVARLIDRIADSDFPVYASVTIDLVGAARSTTARTAAFHTVRG